MKLTTLATAAGLLIAASVSVLAADLPAVSESGVPAFSEAMLSPEFWIRRAPAANAVLLDAAHIAAQRQRVFGPEGGLFDLQGMPAALTRERIAAWAADAERTPIKAVIDEAGQPVTPALLQALHRNADLERIPASTDVRYGLSVRRTFLRALPSERALYAASDALDYESLQAGVLFPGDPAIVAHQSEDQHWLLVFSAQGPGWVKRGDIGIGTADAVFGYASASVSVEAGRVVTGDQVRTVFTPEAPQVSQLELDMGVTMPAAAVKPGEPVNGASSYASWAVRLPVRQPDGALAFSDALLRRTADTAPGYLPLTRANIIRQAFKFLGERYGWGHQFNARDCSGLTSEVYRSMGILLPPNSGQQGTSAALNHQMFTAADSHAARLQALARAQVGDLVVVPGHVLMIIGHLNGQPYVIQDVPYAVFKDPASGAIRKTKLNQVSVTPLLPLYADDKTLYVDAMTSLVRVTRAVGR